jgi:hypothetical protein
MFGRKKTNPLLSEDNNQTAYQNDPYALSKLAHTMMGKPLGSLLTNYIKAVMKAIPKTDTQLKERLNFLISHQEVALVSIFGYDTWATPVKDLDQEQVNAALRGLSWLTSELVERLSTPTQNPLSRSTQINNKEAYQDFQTALNSMSPLRATVIIRNKELNAVPQYQQTSGASSRSTGFSDVYFHWDLHTHCYHYNPCFYDYHHGHWHHCYNDFVWGHGHHHHYGHDFPVARALSNNVFEPAGHAVLDMYSKLFDLQVDAVHGVIRLGGKALEGTGEFLGKSINTLGDVVGNSVHGAGEVAQTAGHCLKDGCGDILHFAGSACHHTGDLFCTIGHGAGHCAADVIGGFCDVFGQCGNICCEVAKLCTHCGDCKCDCPSGGDGDACTVIFGAIGSCCYGTYALIKKSINSCCGSDPEPAPDLPDGSGSMDPQGIIDELSGHEHYSAMTTTGTLVHAGLFGTQLGYASYRDTRIIFNSDESARNRRAAKIDCSARTLAMGAASMGAAAAFGPAYGIKVAVNTAISAGVCAQATSWTGRKYEEKQFYAGVTHPDKYFMTAAQLNRLVTQNATGGTQANRGQEESTLDAVARANTSLYHEAKTEKQAQWALVRRTQALTKVVGCGAHASYCNNPHENKRNAVMGQIERMRNGVLPVSSNPPAYSAQSY